MKFSEKLSKLRKQNNFSQETLAEKLGMSRQAISKWESGSSYPDMATMINICKVLNCTLEDLLDDDAIGKDNFEKNNKININKWLKDLLDFITKSYNMFWSMKFVEKIKCIIEMGFIILILFLIALLVGTILRETVFQVFALLPYRVYDVILNISTIIYSMLCLILGSIITIHLFKIRYLDYFITIEDETVEKKEVEDEVDKKDTIKKEDNNKRKYIEEKRREKVIIRDPKHTTYSFFSGLAKIAIFFIKIFLVMFLIPLVITFISLIVLITIALLCFKYGVIFIGIFIALIGAMLVTYVFIELIFNFIFNRISNLLKIFIIFIAGLIISGIGTGISLYQFSTYDIINDYKYVKNTLELKMNDDIILEYIKNAPIIIDNSIDTINLKVEHLDKYDIYLNSYDDEYYVSYMFNDENIIKETLNNIKKKQINIYDFEYVYNIESITLSEKNYEKLLKNYNDHQEELDREDDCYNYCE